MKRSCGKLPKSDQADKEKRRPVRGRPPSQAVATNIAKLSELLKRPVPYGHALHYQNRGRNLAGPGPIVFRVMREGRTK